MNGRMRVRDEKFNCASSVSPITIELIQLVVGQSLTDSVCTNLRAIDIVIELILVGDLKLGF